MMLFRVRYCLIHAMILYFVDGDVDFTSVRPARCQRHDDDLYIYGVTWTGCQRECRDRNLCLAVSYKRNFHLCVVHFRFNSSAVERCRGYMFSEKHTRNDEGEDCLCEGYQTCSNDGTDLICTLEECKQRSSLPRGSILGNMVTIGSKVKLVCDEGFSLEGGEINVCVDNGTWHDSSGQETEQPTCVSGNRLNDFTVYIGSKICKHYQDNAPAVIEINCSSNKLFGDSVTIVQNLAQPLTLCEVYVF